MTARWIYLLHVSGFVAGVVGIGALARRRAGFMVVVAVVASVAMAVLVFGVSEPGTLFEDFHEAFYVGGAEVLKGPGALVYETQPGVFGYANFPLVAWLFAPFAAMGPLAGAWCFSALGIGAIVAAWVLLVRAARLDRRRALLLLLLFAASGPLHYSIKEANTSHFVFAVIVGALLLLRRGWDFRAGLMLGLAAVLKLPLLLFIVYFVLRGRWRAALGGMAVVVITVALSLAIFGPDIHLQWYHQRIEPAAGNPIPAFNAQSVPSALLRFVLGPSHLRDWKPHVLGPFERLLVSLLVASLYILAVLSAVWRRRRQGAGGRSVPRETTREIELLMVLALSIVTSTLAWSHYFVWFLLPAAFFIGRTDHFRTDWRTRILGWLALVLAALPVISPRLPGGMISQLYARLGVSHLLAGGLILFVLLAWSRWTACSPGDTGGALAGDVADGPEPAGRRASDPGS